jgi:RNA polymerase sigma-70 factor, ECF subfamily
MKIPPPSARIRMMIRRSTSIVRPILSGRGGKYTSCADARGARPITRTRDALETGGRDTHAFRIRVGRSELQLAGSDLKNGKTAEAEDATELFSQHSAGVYRYCLRRLGSPEEAEDALQLTYLNAWRSLKHGFEPRQPRPWLFQIAANVCATSLRSKMRGTRLELRDPSALDELAGPGEPGNEELLGLPQALRDLPSRQRRAMVLRDWHGLSYDEIAAEMAVSDAAVETLLFRARNKVATTLANPDWRRRLAPSRALLIWPFGFLRAKSLATGGAEQLKMGAALAGGTVVPLIAFGLVQVLLSEPKETTQEPQRAAVSQVAQARASGSWQEQLPVRAPMPAEGIPAEGTRKTRIRPQAESRGHATSPKKSGAAHSPKAKANPHVGPEAKVVICHGTHSKKRPGVTISVSKHAVAGGLGKDTRGPC